MHRTKEHVSVILSGYSLFLLILLFILPSPVSSAVVQGVVLLKESRAPASEVEVYVIGRPGYETNADKEGRFRFENIECGIFTVAAKPPGYLPASCRYSLSENDTIDVELLLIPKYGAKTGKSGRPSLTIIVIGGPLAKSVSGAFVKLEGPTQKSQQTDNVGRTIFRNLQPGHYKVKASHPRHGKTEGEVYISPGGVMMEKILRFFSEEAATDSGGGE